MRRTNRLPLLAKTRLWFMGTTLALLILSGCSSISTTSATAFSTGLAAAHVQTDTTFGSIVSLTRSASVDYMAAQPTLDESKLVVVPDTNAVMAWDHAFGALEKYAQQLSSLASGGDLTDVDVSLNSLGAEFNTFSTDLKSKLKLGSGAQLSAGTAAAFSAAGDAILRARGLRQASEVAKKTDPAIHQIFAAFAADIGRDSQSGLRGTVRATWDQRADDLKVRFLQAGSPDNRRPIVESLITLLNQRDAQDEMLVALRSAYLALADAHTALANNNETGLRTASDFVTAEVKRMRDLKSQFSSEKK